MPTRPNQLRRSQIEARLRELGLIELVKMALAGDQGAVFKLASATNQDWAVGAALEFLRPRRRAKNRTVSKLEQAGLDSKTTVLVQGGSPGLKRRR